MAVLLYATTRPESFSGERRLFIQAPPEKVSIQLDFIEPFEGHNMTDFMLSPKNGGTEVRWVMTGPSTFVSKLMGVFVSMDSMVGKDFEKGLAQLKAAAEK